MFLKLIGKITFYPFKQYFNNCNEKIVTCLGSLGSNLINNRLCKDVTHQQNIFLSIGLNKQNKISKSPFSL